MRKRLRIIIATLSLLWFSGSSRCMALTFSNEQLSYRATYKWVIIQKVAGDATMRLTQLPDSSYRAILIARTRPWADPIFSVRDTLAGRMLKGSMLPSLYDKSTHEGGAYRHDVIHYKYHDDVAYASVERYKKDKKGRITRSDSVMSARIPAVDMLSVYFYVRRLPFETMKPGTVNRSNIFSGAKIESLAVKYCGRKKVKLDGVTWDCYEIHFSFSSERMNNSSAPMKAWIRTDGTRIPIKLEGELPIGKIQVLWNNPDKK
ncbi:MAG: DUF3108 domain-containing protein [Muribaculaceae bacterium]|nr:DUF3108 domain-containing protein [Muribaculaceae bacterium]